MTAPSSSRVRKRARKEEEETPPRPTLDDLEREDRAQLTPGRAVWDQPQVADSSRAVPEQAAAPDRARVAGPQQGIESTGQGRSATRHQGQSSITDLSGAGQDAHAGRPYQQQEASDGQSIGEVLTYWKRPIMLFLGFHLGTLHREVYGEHCTGSVGRHCTCACWGATQRGFMW